MKKNILFLAPIMLLGTFVFGQLTPVPDSNFEQALINLGHDSGPINGTIPTANIDTVVNLNVSGLSISDLTGIEAFTALKILDCNSNSLTSLNVSQNANLTDFRCDVNQLTSLDVTQNNSLLYLNCGVNQISNIDLTQNIALITFSCDLSPLSSLDVSQNIALTYLRCPINQLTNVDVRNGNNANFTYFDVQINPNLKCIYVDDKNAGFLSAWIKDTSAHYVNDSLDCQSVSFINEHDKINPIHIYPNPASEYTMFEVEKLPVELTVYDLGNKLIFQENIITKRFKMNTTDLEKGIYLCHLNYKGIINRQKLIVI